MVRVVRLKKTSKYKNSIFSEFVFPMLGVSFEEVPKSIEYISFKNAAPNFKVNLFDLETIKYKIVSEIENSKSYDFTRNFMLEADIEEMAEQWDLLNSGRSGFSEVILAECMKLRSEQLHEINELNGSKRFYDQLLCYSKILESGLPVAKGITFSYPMKIGVLDSLEEVFSDKITNTSMENILYIDQDIDAECIENNYKLFREFRNHSNMNVRVVNKRSPTVRLSELLSLVKDKDDCPDELKFYSSHSRQFILMSKEDEENTKFKNFVENFMRIPYTCARVADSIIVTLSKELKQLPEPKFKILSIDKSFVDSLAFNYDEERHMTMKKLLLSKRKSEQVIEVLKKRFFLRDPLLEKRYDLRMSPWLTGVTLEDLKRCIKLEVSEKDESAAYIKLLLKIESRVLENRLSVIAPTDNLMSKGFEKVEIPNIDDSLNIIIEKSRNRTLKYYEDYDKVYVEDFLKKEKFGNAVYEQIVDRL